MIGTVALGAAFGLPAVAAMSAASAATVPPRHPAADSGAQRPAQAQQAAARATLTLNAGTALPSQSVGFSGRGFKAGEKVTLHWGSAGGVTLTTVTASKAGTVSGTFHVPLPRAGVSARVALTAVGASSKTQGGASFVQSCTDEWTDLSGGSWSTARDWSTGAVPGAGTAACITLSGPKSYTVTLGASATVGSLQVGAQSGKFDETLAASAGSKALNLTLNHASTVHANGELALTATGSGGDYLKGAGVLDNFGLLTTLSGKGEGRYLDASIVNEASGTVSVATGANTHGGTVQGSGTTLVSQGTLNVLKGAEYDVAAGATLTQAGGDASNGGTLEVSGTVEKQGGSAGGSAWKFLRGALLQDKAGAGSYTFTGSGTLSGTIAAGQTVTVDGDASARVDLGLDGTVTNDGTLTLTASGDHGADGDGAGLAPAPGTSGATLDNDGTVLTSDGDTTSSSGESLSGGDSGTRYFGVDVTNEAGGTLKLDASANQVDAGVTLANDGTLNLGVSASLNLAGGAGGEADLADGPDSTTSIALDSDTGASSVIDQLMCSDPACANESIKLDGTLKVDQSGDGTVGVYVPVFSMVSNLSGTFSAAPSPLSPVYNGSGISIPGVVGSLLLTLP